MAVASASYVEASVNLEACSPACTRSHRVTPKAAGLASDLSLASQLPVELASSVSVFFPRQTATQGWVLARLIEEDRCVELRWLSLVQEEPGELDMTLDTMPGLYNELDKHAATPPVRFVFADPLVPSIHVTEADGALIVHVLSRKGVLTRLMFHGRHFFLSRELDEDISGDYTVSALSGRTPVSFHGVSDDTALIACTDGGLISLRRTASREEHWQESELSVTSGLWPVRALLPTRFSTRNLAALSATEANSPAQTVSAVSLVGGSDVLFDLTYTLSRDYKLRVWQNHLVCARTLDLAPSSSSLLSPQPRNLVRAVLTKDDAEYSAYVVVVVVDRFQIYGVPRGKRRETELRQIGIQAFPSTYSVDELRDFQVALVNPAATHSDQDWVLWMLWEMADGEPSIAFSELAKAGSGTDEPWTYVRSPDQVAWSADHFDDLLAGDTTRSVNDIFMEHVFKPGRYATDTIVSAVDQYKEQARESTSDRDALYALSRDDYESLAEQVADVVGCTLALETSAETGQPLYAQFESRVRTEWLRFVSLCNEGRALARYPLLLATDGTRQTVLALTRGAVIAPVQADQVVGLEAATKEAEDSGRLIAATPQDEALAIVLRVARTLQDSLAPQVLREFAAAVLAINRSPRKEPTEELAAGLFADHIEGNLSDDIFDDMRDAIQPALPHLADIGALLFSPAQDATANDGASQATDFALALATVAAVNYAEARSALVLQHLLLLVYLAIDPDVTSPTARDLLPQAFAAAHGLHVLQWLTSQGGPPLSPPEEQPDDSGSLTTRLGGLKVGNDQDSTAEQTPTLSLFGFLGRSRLPAAIQAGVVSSRALYLASASLIDSLGLLSLYAAEGDASLVKFLADAPLPAQALALAHFYPSSDPGMRFAEGMSLLGLGRYAEAQRAFEKSATGLDSSSTSSAPLATVLSADIWESPERLFLYYRQCATLFAEASYPAGVVTFAHFALDARTSVPASETGVDVEDLARTLWQQLFEAQASLQLFEEAYTTLMAIPDAKIQETCLRILVVQMCEAGEVQLLLRFSFANLQQRLAEHLDYRARHAKFGAVPDYHQIAYSYHLSRGSYKDAAAVMVRRIRQLDSRATAERVSFYDAARERCRSYLAAINALYLVDKDDAWLAVPADGSTFEPEQSVSEGKRRQTIDGSAPPAAKRRRLASGKHIVVDHIPAEAHTTAPAQVDVLTLDILREEYALALAKLTLSGSFPELARTDLDMDPEGVVALYAEKGEISNAFAVAQTLDADMSGLFERLTERCVQLSRSGAYLSESDADWLNSLDEAAGLEGSFASRVWQVLRLYLDRYDKPDGRYRIAVIKKALSVERGLRIPLWLIARFAEKDPDSLLRALIAHDRLDDALSQALALVQRASQALSRGQDVKTAFLRLPYPLLDSLLRVRLAEDDEFETSARQMQGQLEGALKELLRASGKQDQALRTAYRKEEYARASKAVDFSPDR